MNRYPGPSRRMMLGALACTAAAPLLPGATTETRMLLCGDDTVYDVRVAGSPEKPVWQDVRTWVGNQATEIPSADRTKWFRTTDDCKPIDDGRSVLVTSSSGGVAIYDRASRKTKFYGFAANAHSACLLPGGYVVVAASVNANGNALVLFHRDQSAKELFRTPLESAHGVVWDEDRKILYAIGMHHVEEYAFEPASLNRPLRLLKQNRMPSSGGHELSPGPAPNLLFASGADEVFLFNKDTRAFARHPVLGAMHHVKCISRNPQTGQIAYVKADEGEGVWWSFQVRFLYPGAEAKTPGKRLYKVRWA
jgi:hypothetical protein